MVQLESKTKYEDIRNQRLQENKRKMEDLKLNILSTAIRKPIAKPSPAKSRVFHKKIDCFPVRRSVRMENKPPPSYREVPIEPLMRLRTRRLGFSYQRRDLLNRIYASHEQRIYAIDRAEQLVLGLDSQYPSFIKPMLQSHVTGGFWLGLPLHFCKAHLPDYDEMMTLVDEEGDEFEAKYLGAKNGLSGGWRGFSIDHELVDGDAVVFHLVEPTVFKVYIIRAYETKESEGEGEDELNEQGQDNKESDVTRVRRTAKRVRAGK